MTSLLTLAIDSHVIFYVMFREWASEWRHFTRCKGMGCCAPAGVRRRRSWRDRVTSLGCEVALQGGLSPVKVGVSTFWTGAVATCLSSTLTTRITLKSRNLTKQNSNTCKNIKQWNCECTYNFLSRNISFYLLNHIHIYIRTWPKLLFDIKSYLYLIYFYKSITKRI